LPTRTATDTTAVTRNRSQTPRSLHDRDRVDRSAAFRPPGRAVDRAGASKRDLPSGRIERGNVLIAEMAAPEVGALTLAEALDLKRIRPALPLCAPPATRRGSLHDDRGPACYLCAGLLLPGRAPYV